MDVQKETLKKGPKGRKITTKSLLQEATTQMCEIILTVTLVSGRPQTAAFSLF